VFITDFLVCIGFYCLRFGFCFVFPGVLFLPVHVRKRRGGLKPATTAQPFDRSTVRAVKIP
jgi:hypothetical protein